MICRLEISFTRPSEPCLPGGMVARPDMLLKKLLKHGAEPRLGGDELLWGSLTGSISGDDGPIRCGLSELLIPGTDRPSSLLVLPVAPAPVSDLRFRFLRKFPLSNIFSQLGSNVQ